MMFKKELRTMLNIARKDIDRAKSDLKIAEEHLKTLEEHVEYLDKSKPIMYLRYNAPSWFEGLGNKEVQITHYRKYSDEFIEFEAFGFVYRYIKTYESNTLLFPDHGLNTKIIKQPQHLFEIYDFAYKRYVPVDYIDHIELIEGVNEYDK